MDFGLALPHVFDEPIVTDRLRLRLMTPDDVDDIYAYQSRDDVCAYLLFEPRTRDQVADKVAAYAKATTLWRDGDYLQLALELREGEPRAGRVIGDSYFTLSSLENSRAEIGWSLHPDFAGRGYASEAARAVLGLAFDVIGLHRVYAELDAKNGASVALCKRLGMREEALFLEDMWFKGGWSDTGVYAIRRSEWQASRGQGDV
jgi:RimJ/RimL family protein N-acetyltransferase